MLKYLIVILDDKSVSFCHYEIGATESKLMSLDDLKRVVKYGMKENLGIQFVYPDYPLPQEYREAIDSVDHVNIVSEPNNTDDICVTDISSSKTLPACKTLTLRGTIQEFCSNVERIVKNWSDYTRLNFILTHLESVKEADTVIYKKFLEELSDAYIKDFKEGKALPQINVLTDRFSLESMNNCNAGAESITFAPDGNFYICPAFYYDGEECLKTHQGAPEIPNKQLFELEYAPICRKCDAFQCHRCVWMNRKKTLEVNTPGHIQCVLSHIERNASRILLEELKKAGCHADYKEIKEIDFLDPFDIIKS